MAGKMIAVGDNVVDCYLDDHVYYPGGNAVNVAVNCRRDGIEDVAYIGMFGNDGKAEHLKWALTQENVHFERSRTMYAPSGSPGVRLIDGDRKFVGGPRNTAQHVARIRLTPEDLDYIEQYGLCHTSCFSSIEYELPEMAKRCQVSFDFSERTDPDYLARVCPYVTYAFFSGSHMTAEEIGFAMERLFETGALDVWFTAIGMKKQFPTVIQEDAKELEYMHVSGGKLGMQIRLAPQDLQKVAKAEFADVIRP